MQPAFKTEKKKKKQKHETASDWQHLKIVSSIGKEEESKEGALTRGCWVASFGTAILKNIQSGRTQ